MNVPDEPIYQPLVRGRPLNVPLPDQPKPPVYTTKEKCRVGVNLAPKMTPGNTTECGFKLPVDEDEAMLRLKPGGLDLSACLVASSFGEEIYRGKFTMVQRSRTVTITEGRTIANVSTVQWTPPSGMAALAGGNLSAESVRCWTSLLSLFSSSSGVQYNDQIIRELSMGATNKTGLDALLLRLSSVVAAVEKKLMEGSRELTLVCSEAAEMVFIDAWGDFRAALEDESKGKFIVPAVICSQLGSEIGTLMQLLLSSRPLVEGEDGTRRILPLACWPTMEACQIVGFRRHMSGYSGSPKLTSSCENVIAMAFTIAKCFGHMDTVCTIISDLRILQSAEVAQTMTIKLEAPVGPPPSYGACFRALDVVQETVLELPSSMRLLAEQSLKAGTVAMILNFVWHMALWATFRVGDTIMPHRAIAIIWQKLAFREENICQLWSELSEDAKRLQIELRFSRWFSALIPRFENIAVIVDSLTSHNAILPWRYSLPQFGPHPLFALNIWTTSLKLLDWMRRYSGKVVSYREMNQEDAQTFLCMAAYMLISVGDVKNMTLVKYQQRQSGEIEARPIHWPSLHDDWSKHKRKLQHIHWGAHGFWDGHKNLQWFWRERKVWKDLMDVDHTTEAEALCSMEHDDGHWCRQWTSSAASWLAL